jgi:flagellar hook-basal body complex protein FliE
MTDENTEEKKKDAKQSAKESGEKFGKATSDAFNNLSTKTKAAYNASKDFIEGARKGADKKTKKP